MITMSHQDDNHEPSCSVAGQNDIMCGLLTTMLLKLQRAAFHQDGSVQVPSPSCQRGQRGKKTIRLEVHAILWKPWVADSALRDG